MRFDSNITSFKKKYKMVLLFSIILILVILMYNIIINNHSNNEIILISKNSRRIISNLDNYTETMSDFIVNNNYNYINEIQKGFKEKELQIQKEQLQIQKEQLQIQKELKGFKEKELQIQKEQLDVRKGFKELEVQIRKNAIEFLENNYGIKPYYYNLDFFINYNKCIKKLLDLDIDLFSLLLNIDYENLTVSFNYFNDNKDYNLYDGWYDYANSEYHKEKLLVNYYENIINNPIYKNLKNKLEIDYDYRYNFEYYDNLMNYYENNFEYYNINNISYIYNEYISIKIVINNDIEYYNNYPNPYKETCNIGTIKGNHICSDSSRYDHSTNITQYNSHNCNTKIIENDKFNRYSYLPKPYQNINTIYINEYEYIRQLINLEIIPIIPPIKF